MLFRQQTDMQSTSSNLRCNHYAQQISQVFGFRNTQIWEIFVRNLSDIQTESELLGLFRLPRDFHEGHGPAQYGLSPALFVNWRDMTVSVQ